MTTTTTEAFGKRQTLVIDPKEESNESTKNYISEIANGSERRCECGEVWERQTGSGGVTQTSTHRGGPKGTIFVQIDAFQSGFRVHFGSFSLGWVVFWGLYMSAHGFRHRSIRVCGIPTKIPRFDFSGGRNGRRCGGSGGSLE